MFDDTNQETTQPEIIPTESPTQQVQEEVVTREDDQSRNFKQLREKTDRIAKERDEAIARLREYESRIKSQSPTQASDMESDEVSMAPDELAEGKHISKVQKQLNK